MSTSTEELDLKKILELTDPVTWLRNNTAFYPFTYEAEILRDAGLRLRVIRKARQIGITTTIAHEATWKACTTPNRLILIVSPSDRQSAVAMNRIHNILESSPHLTAMITHKKTNELQFTTHSSILSLPNNPDRLRGFTATDIYLDEAAWFLNDEPVMRAIKPMLIASKGTLTIISTPFGKRGLFWEQYKIVTDQKGTREDQKAYDLFPSTINPLVKEEELEAERLNMTDLEYRQEYQAEFIEQADVYFPLNLITPCVNNLQMITQGDKTHTYFMGIDLAKQRDETVVIILEKQKTPEQLIVRHISNWTHMDYTEQITRISQLAQSFPTARATIDQTGVGEAVVDGLKLKVRYLEGIKFTQEIKQQLITSLRLLLEQKKLTIPNDPKLIMQLNNLHYTISATGNMIFHTPQKHETHDDYVWALALATHAAQHNPASLLLIGAKQNW